MTACSTSGTLPGEHEHIHLREAYNLVGKTDVYQVMYKWKMTCIYTDGEGKYKNEEALAKLPWGNDA